MEAMNKEGICKLRDLYRAIATLEAQFEQQFGLNINELMLLCTLNDQPSMTSGELATALALTHSNMSKVIRAVEDKKLIVRKFDKNDRRVIRFAVTKAGQERLASVNCNDIKLPEQLQAIVTE